MPAVFCGVVRTGVRVSRIMMDSHASFSVDGNDSGVVSALVSKLSKCLAALDPFVNPLTNTITCLRSVSGDSPHLMDLHAPLLELCG